MKKLNVSPIATQNADQASGLPDRDDVGFFGGILRGPVPGVGKRGRRNLRTFQTITAPRCDRECPGVPGARRSGPLRSEILWLRWPRRQRSPSTRRPGAHVCDELAAFAFRPDPDVGESPRPRSMRFDVRDRRRASHANRSSWPNPCRTASGIGAVATTSDTAKPFRPAEEHETLRGNTCGLSGERIDDAIGDNDIDAVVGDRQVLDFRRGELGVRIAAVPRAFARLLLTIFRRHVDNR